MKRNIKGIISLLLAVVMLFGCGTTAMAATVGKTLKLGVYQSLTAKEAIDENSNYIA